MQRRDTFITAAMAAVLVLAVQWVTGGILRADNSSTPVKVNTFVSGNLIRASELNTNFDDLYTGLRNVGTANILDNAITTTKIVDANVTQQKLETLVQNALAPTGTVLDYLGSTAPSGWVFPDGKTIGDASSAATERANADTQALFVLEWNSLADAQAPVSGGRGASATADFNAHKTITLPDLRGRVVAGRDNLGGSSASRLTVGVSGFDPTVQGNAGGDERRPTHNHGITDPGHFHNVSHAHLITDQQHSHTTALDTTATFSNGTGGVLGRTIAGGSISTNSVFTGITATQNANPASDTKPTLITINSDGSGTAQNTQPTMALTKIIKL